MNLTSAARLVMMAGAGCALARADASLIRISAPSSFRMGGYGLAYDAHRAATSLSPGDFRIFRLGTDGLMERYAGRPQGAT